jgi:hypothetical protein
VNIVTLRATVLSTISLEPSAREPHNACTKRRRKFVLSNAAHVGSTSSCSALIETTFSTPLLPPLFIRYKACICPPLTMYSGLLLPVWHKVCSSTSSSSLLLPPPTAAPSPAAADNLCVRRIYLTVVTQYPLYLFIVLPVCVALKRLSLSNAGLDVYGYPQSHHVGRRGSLGLPNDGLWCPAHSEEVPLFALG